MTAPLYRIRELSNREGLIGTYSDPHVGYSYTRVADGNGTWKECRDWIRRYWAPNTLFIQSNSEHYWSLEGELRVGDDVIVKYENFPIDVRPVAETGMFPESWLNPDLIAIAHHIAGRTNPSKPGFNLPRAVGELRDLAETGMSIADVFAGLTGNVKRRGARYLRWLRRTLSPRSVASKLLLWRFGIAPMVSDYKKLMKLQELCDRRIQMLQRLASGKPLRKMVRIGDESSVVDMGRTHLHSLGSNIYAKKLVALERHQWGTVKWSPLLADVLAPGCPHFMPGGRNYHLDVKYDTLGINEFGALAAWWELIPWSWLGSWFANYAAWLDANNYSIPVQPFDMCYMATMSASSYYEDRDKPSWVHLRGTMAQRHERKYRIPIDNSALWIPPLTTISQLGGGQLSTLAALATLEYPRASQL